MDPMEAEAGPGPGTEAAAAQAAAAQAAAQGAPAQGAPDIPTQLRNLLPDALAQAATATEAGAGPGAPAAGAGAGDGAPAPLPPAGFDPQLYAVLASFGQQVTHSLNSLGTQLLGAIREGNTAIRQPKPALFGDEEMRGSPEAIAAWVDIALSLVQQPFQILFYFRGEPQVWAARQLQQIREPPHHYPSGSDLRDRFLHRFVGQGKQGSASAAAATGSTDTPFPHSGVTMANVAAVRQGRSGSNTFNNKRTAATEAGGSGGGKVAKTVQPPNAEQQKRIDQLLRVNNPYSDNRAKANMRQAPMFPNSTEEWGSPPAGLKPVEDCVYFQSTDKDVDQVVRGEIMRYWWLCSFCKTARHWKGDCEAKKEADRKRNQGR